MALLAYALRPSGMAFHEALGLLDAPEEGDRQEPV
jgi:hypothetical protein